MRKRLPFIGLILLMSLACAKNNSPVEKKEPAPKEKIKSRKVLVIGIDGCRPDALVAANTPNINALIANGTYSMDAQNTGITSSGPGWSSMLTGVWQDKHKVIDNSFNGADFSSYPHFFKRIKEADSNSRTVSVSQWHPINDKIALSEADIIRNTDDTSIDVRNKAVAELSIDKLTALFVHFDDVDHAGHGSGFHPTNPNYIDAIERVDNEIGYIMTALESRNNYSDENWIVILSTDHGGKGRSHGGTSEEERTIFMIVSGDSVANKEIQKTTSQVTVQPVLNCLNSATELYFDGNTHISIPNNAAYNFGATQDFSIECRFRSNEAADVSIVAKKDWESGLLPGYVFSFKPGSQKFKVNIGDGSNRVDVETAIITDNEWHTVSATFDRDGMLSVYIDGVFSKAISMVAIGNIDTSFPLTIGKDGNGDYAYTGYIAEVRVFDRLLSSETIETWKCKALDSSHPNYNGLQGYWKLNEGSGTAIIDASSIGADGILYGENWKDANAVHTKTESDYSHTPRTVDVVKTALNHLCIPIQDSWGLEGNSLIETACHD